MPWKGITLRMRLLFLRKVVRDDIFTSIHVDDYSLEVRDTKLGNEELTNDIQTFLKSY
jgi:DNA-directed RNA polymerase subunit beta